MCIPDSPTVLRIKCNSLLLPAIGPPVCHLPVSASATMTSGHNLLDSHARYVYLMHAITVCHMDCGLIVTTATLHLPRVRR